MAEQDEGARYGYFVLHARSATQAGVVSLRVELENLGTGDRTSFRSGAEVGRFLDEWSGRVAGDARFEPPPGGEGRR